MMQGLGPCWSEVKTGREVLPTDPGQEEASVASVLLWVAGNPHTPEIPLECRKGKAFIKDLGR